MVTIGDPWAESPKASERWEAMSDDERLAAVKAPWTRAPVTFLRAQANGHVICEIPEGMKAAERGPLLLSVERLLMDNVDAGIRVYLEPAQDRNALRRLRGVKVAE